MSYDQIRVKPYPISYRVYLGVAKYGVWYSQNACIEMQKISCKSLQKSDWSYGNERKTSPTNHTQFTWLKQWIKEENGVHKGYDKSNVSPYGSCYHSFCMQKQWRMKKRMGTSELVKIRCMIRGCGYEWMMRTASRRMNHTLIRNDAGRTKLNQISGSLFLFIFITNPTCSHEKKINGK